MINYFEELYDNVYEYTYDTIIEKKTINPNRGGGNN